MATQTTQIKCPSCNKTEHALFGRKNNYDMFECQSCSLIFVDPIPGNEELNAFYQNCHKHQYLQNTVSSVLDTAFCIDALE